MDDKTREEEAIKKFFSDRIAKGNQIKCTQCKADIDSAFFYEHSVGCFVPIDLSENLVASFSNVNLTGETSSDNKQEGFETKECGAKCMSEDNDKKIATEV